MKKLVTSYFRLKVQSCYQLNPGAWHGVRFDGVERASCYAFPDGHGVRLAYHLNGKPVVSDVSFCWTSQPFGGRRMWLVCPQCGTRRGCLYFTADGLQCTDCLGKLLYPCQVSERDGLALASRWRGRLLHGELKPKRMHWSTYERLWERICEREEIAALRVLGGLEGLLNATNNG